MHKKAQKSKNIDVDPPQAWRTWLHNINLLHSFQNMNQKQIKDFELKYQAISIRGTRSLPVTLHHLQRLTTWNTKLSSKSKIWQVQP